MRKKPMAVGKMPVDEQGYVKMNRQQMRAWGKELVEEAVMKTMLACAGYLMEEEEFDKDGGNRIADMWEGVSRYVETINDPNSPFKAKDLAKTVSKYTGVKVYWK